MKIAKSKKRLSSVANALRLMKVFSDEEYEIGISNLAKRLGLAKSTVHRLATTLIDAGMVEQNSETGKYRLGLALFELGSLVRRKMDVSSEAKPFLTMLREKTGETAHLAILDQSSVLYVNKVESRSAIRMGSSVGARAPVYCTAVGKSLLAFQPEETVERIIGLGLPARTPGTITDPRVLRRELAAVRARGYAVENEECEIGLCCVAAPVWDHSGRVVAAMSIAGPAHRMRKKTLLSYARSLVETADATSQRLGHQVPRVHQAHSRA